jgi:hypothetical protein
MIEHTPPREQPIADNETIETRCYDLAKYFLNGLRLDTEARRLQLAAHLRADLESWYGFEEDEVSALDNPIVHPKC